MRIDTRKFTVGDGKEIDLEDWPTSVKPYYGSNEDYESKLDKHIKELQRLQDLFYAHHRYALLIIFQAMDAAGKDSAIKHVMSGLNPQGCEVHSFKHPSAVELAHDFLWRTNQCLPERGRIGIFNRSYYEEVLIVRVHPEILAGEQLPGELLDKKSIWKNRFRSINDLENHLHRNGTRIIKFFLHVSKREQKKRFLKRVEDSAKGWKFSLNDVNERGFWKDYMSAYADCLSHTSAKDSPWHVIPADDKKNARLIISQVILEALESLKMEYPKPAPRVLKAARRLLLPQ